MNDISLPGCELLCQTLSKTRITQLNVSSNPLKNKGIQKLGEALDRSGVILTSLNISDCHFNSNGASYIYNGVKRNGRLQELIMNKNNLRGKTLFLLAQMLFTNSRLKKLSL